MLKKDELTNQQSCLNRAKEDEMVFTLLARDITAPIVIETWIQMRIACGKNKPDDSQIVEARRCAEVMRQQYISKIAEQVASSAQFQARSAA